MKIVVQRVKKASVEKKDTNETFGKINNGLLVLLGIKKGDTYKDADYLAEKLVKLRVMSDEKGKMNLSVKDVEGNVLVISQFTLYGETKGQNRPSFIKAEEPQKALKLYKYFIDKLRKLGVQVETGSFGDYMEITSVLDGPVTIILEN